MIFSYLRYPITLQGDTLGSPITVTLPAKGKSLTLRIRCGSREEVVEENNTQGEFHWTPPLSLAQEYPRDNRIPVTLILEQYRKEIRVASRQEQILLALPEEIHPQVLLSYTDAQGCRQTYGGFVQGKSRLALTAQATGSFGAEIGETELESGGFVCRGKSATFDLPQAGEISLAARVWDDRGRSAQASGKIQVLPYSPPTGEITAVTQKDGTLVSFRGRVTALGGKNQGSFTVLMQQEGGAWQRFPAAQGWEAEGEVTLPALEESWALALEVKDDFETVVIPYHRRPFLDMLPEKRALGIGCRAETAGKILLGLTLDAGGNPIENLGAPQKDGDALTLGYGERTYWHPRLLWENPAPDSPFASQTLDIAGDFLLIEAAVEAGKPTAFWELGKNTALLRAAEGVHRTVERTDKGLTFGTTASGDGFAVPLRIYG